MLKNNSFLKFYVFEEFKHDSEHLDFKFIINKLCFSSDKKLLMLYKLEISCLHFVHFLKVYFQKTVT